MPSDSHRLSILTAEEIEDLYGFPRFTDEDRHQSISRVWATK